MNFFLLSLCKILCHFTQSILGLTAGCLPSDRELVAAIALKPGTITVPLEYLRTTRAGIDIRKEGNPASFEVI